MYYALLSTTLWDGFDPVCSRDSCGWMKKDRGSHSRKKKVLVRFTVWPNMWALVLCTHMHLHSAHVMHALHACMKHYSMEGVTALAFPQPAPIMYRNSIPSSLCIATYYAASLLTIFHQWTSVQNVEWHFESVGIAFMSSRRPTAPARVLCTDNVLKWHPRPVRMPVALGSAASFSLPAVVGCL